MSAISDPDRLERFARYVMDQPMNVTPVELSAALGDAAARIRRHQESDRARHGTGAEMIAAERRRQVEQKGWAPGTAVPVDDAPLTMWAFVEAWKSRGDPVENLIRVGALIAAEIERLTAPSRSEADERALKAGQDARDLMRERYDEMLASIVLYIDWHYVTKQLTTEQKELFAAALERHRGGLPMYAPRWWRSEAGTDDHDR